MFKKLLKYNFIVLSTTLMRASLIREFSGSPNFVYAEEYDLFLKITNKYKLDFIAEPLVSYRYHDNNESSKLLENQLEECKEIYNIWAQNTSEKEIMEICNYGIGNTYYGIGRRILFHLGKSNNARPYFKSAFKINKRAIVLMFLLSTYLPNTWLQSIRSGILNFKKDNY